ncbi:calcium-binding mitochondrial carrier protein SCaMC-2 isoform 2 [Xenopus tropicalis]|uniref:Calcium-binding mitochondrial carrier protein SCaMC-2 isoform 2 n=1 Tax=Xenopus tropicalis TaxID=8364 RepID=A0A8J0PH97_XENTR
MARPRSLVSPLLSGVFCQCDTVGGAPHTHDTPASPSLAAALAADPCGGLVCGGPEHETRLQILFQELDVNKDGGICINDLAVGLKRLGVHRTELELRVSRMLGAGIYFA